MANTFRTKMTTLFTKAIERLWNMLKVRPVYCLLMAFRVWLLVVLKLHATSAFLTRGYGKTYSPPEQRRWLSQKGQGLELPHILLLIFMKCLETLV